MFNSAKAAFLRLGVTLGLSKPPPSLPKPNPIVRSTAVEDLKQLRSSEKSRPFFPIDPRNKKEESNKD